MRILAIFMIISSIVIFIMGCLISISNKPIMEKIIVMIFFIIMSILYFYAGYKDIKRKVPKGFDIFEENI
ncbi:uncharacterized protein YacL [Clostridium beijerinckii]|nr:uncharacterized protein YacL [Clostridium beijerinckii]NYC05697.1 uncharacterized protein YacL [Clostridium beijerinckii]